MKKISSVVAQICLILLPFTLSAQATKTIEKTKPIPSPKSFTTKHTLKINGENLAYQVTGEELYLKDKNGKPVASFWSTAYTLPEGKTAKSSDLSRPVCFVFNGGPGSASIWLHMGLLGPKLVQVDSDAIKDDGAAPFTMTDNPYALLDITDLIFIDPIGTGYSRVVGKGKVENYWGLNEDAKSVAAFIRMWTTKHQRWNAPKYLIGESFGTTRAAAIADELMGGGQDMALNGLVMISQALDYAGSTSIHDNITSYLTYLPSMAATAWYHKKAGNDKTLEAFVEEARQFTYDVYAPALYRGNFLKEADKTNIINQLAYFTGLDKTYIAQSNLRILMPRFQKELLRAENKTLGRLDGRYYGNEADQIAERPTLGDASSYKISSAYTAALQSYYASDLTIQMERPYLTSNRAIYPKWNWKPVPKNSGWEPNYVNTSRRLARAMRKNTGLKVLVASGYYDLITPFFDAEYTFSRNGILTDKVDFKYYEGGHMMYTHHPALKQLCQDIRTFLTVKK